MNNCIDHGQVGNSDGYASTTVANRRTGMHRAIYVAHNKLALSDIDGLVVRHTCDNPRCINPEHLLIGTQKDNVADCKERGRLNRASGEAHGSAKLTDVDCLKIVEVYAAGGTTQRELARLYKVSHVTIGAVVRKNKQLLEDIHEHDSGQCVCCRDSDGIY